MFDLTIEGRTARLTLNRPEARNAIPETAWRALAAALSDVGDARVLIVDAVGAAFCAGADLGDLTRLAADAAAAGGFRAAMRAGLDAVRALSIPTIAAIDGGCYGAGVALAMACDIRLAGEAAIFSIPPARFGITYPFEDVARLVALVGRAQAARLLYGAITIDAQEAARIGLAEEAVAHAGRAADALAQAIAANAPSSIAGLATMIDRAGGPADAAMDALFDESFASDAFVTGFAGLRGVRAKALDRT